MIITEFSARCRQSPIVLGTGRNFKNGKLDHHVSAGRKRDGYKQLPVSVEFPKYGNTLFRPVWLVNAVGEP